jgi:hypothetical protein
MPLDDVVNCNARSVNWRKHLDWGAVMVEGRGGCQMMDEAKSRRDVDGEPPSLAHVQLAVPAVWRGDVSVTTATSGALRVEQ